MADRLNIANPNAKTGFYTAKKDQGIGYIGVGCPYEGGRALYKVRREQRRQETVFVALCSSREKSG